MRTSRILIAPDKFKGSLTAADVAARIAAGIHGAVPSATCIALPLADGGDGSVDAAISAGFTARRLRVGGPTGEPLVATVAISGSTAVIEAASICGLSVLAGGRLEPMRSSSCGIGDAIAALVPEPGISRIVLALGGSATSDGGMGMLHALGARFLDERGDRLEPSGSQLARVHRVDLSSVIDLEGVEIVAATDVRNPLLGQRGAAVVFGPQKGATASQVAELELGLSRLVAALGDRAAVLSAEPGAGSAGGLGFAVLHIGGRVVSGADYFLDLLGFDALAADADLVITGEGSLDEQTAGGKLVAVVAARSPSPVVAIVGRSTLTPEQSAALGLAEVRSISAGTTRDTAGDPDLSAALVRDAASAIARSRLPEAQGTTV